MRFIINVVFPLFIVVYGGQKLQNEKTKMHRAIVKLYIMCCTSKYDFKTLFLTYHKQFLHRLTLEYVCMSSILCYTLIPPNEQFLYMYDLNIGNDEQSSVIQILFYHANNFKEFIHIEYLRIVPHFKMLPIIIIFYIILSL